MVKTVNLTIRLSFTGREYKELRFRFKTIEKNVAQYQEENFRTMRIFFPLRGMCPGLPALDHFTAFHKYQFMLACIEPGIFF